MTPAAGRRRAAVPVVGFEVAPSERDGRRLRVPLLCLDARGRPDVADLPRVHAAEPGGETAAAVRVVRRGSDTTVLVRFATRRPVRHVFRVLLSARDHAEILRLLADAELVGFACAPGAWVYCPVADVEPLRALPAAFTQEQ